MKAVLIIDMPDGVSLDEWSAVKVTVDRVRIPKEEMLKGVQFDESKTFKFVPLRPLPAKTGQSASCKDIAEACRLGWDMCIDTITGETE